MLVFDSLRFAVNVSLDLMVIVSQLNWANCHDNSILELGRPRPSQEMPRTRADAVGERSMWSHGTSLSLKSGASGSQNERGVYTRFSVRQNWKSDKTPLTVFLCARLPASLPVFMPVSLSFCLSICLTACLVFPFSFFSPFSLLFSWRLTVRRHLQSDARGVY